MSDSSQLNARQRLFVCEYAIDHNATQAAIRAGYSERTGYSQGQRLLKNVEIRKQLKMQEEDVRKRLSLDHEWVLARLMREADEAASPSSRVRSLEILGRHLGLFAEQPERPPPKHTMHVDLIPPALTKEETEALLSTSRVLRGATDRARETALQLSSD